MTKIIGWIIKNNEPFGLGRFATETHSQRRLQALFVRAWHFATCVLGELCKLRNDHLKRK